MGSLRAWHKWSGHGLRGLSNQMLCVATGERAETQRLMHTCQRHLKVEKLQWGLGSEGRCLDLRPHGQARAATVRAVVVLEGDSHSGRRQLSGGPDTGCSPHLAHVRASSLAAAVTGQGALLRVSSKIPGQGLNLQGQGRRAAPCLCVQAAVRKTEPSRRYACAHTHTH